MYDGLIMTTSNRKKEIFTIEEEEHIAHGNITSEIDFVEREREKKRAFKA